MNAPTGNAGPQDLNALEGEIRASRARIDDTVDALRDRMARLSPRSLMEQTMKHTYTPADRAEHSQTVHNQGGYRSRSSSSSMMESMTSNPIPLALVGVGLGWLALSTTGYDRRIARSGAVSSMRHRASDAAEYVTDTFGSATDSVRNAAGSAYDSASGAVSGAYDSASGAVSGAYDSASGAVSGMMGGGSDSASNRMPTASHSGPHMRERMHSVSTGFWDMVEDHPVVAGAMGVALGAAIGAALPSTHYENRWVGEYADEATERAKTLAMDALDRGTRAAQAAVDTAKEEMSEAVTHVGDAVREEAKKPA